jgi:hypothetical protein
MVGHSRFLLLGVLVLLLHAPASADEEVIERITHRAGKTVFQESSRVIAAATAGDLAMLAMAHLPPGFNRVIPRLLSSGLYYAGYKTGTDLTRYILAKKNGEEPRPLDVREIGLVTTGATLGHFLGSRLLGPIGGWIGQYLGWTFAETLADLARQDGAWDMKRAWREIDVPRIVASAITLEAVGLAALRLTGLNPRLPAIGASPGRVIVGLTAKVVAMSLASVGFDAAYDRVTGKTAKAPEPQSRGQAYERLVRDLKAGDTGAARESLRAFQEKKETRLLAEPGLD